MSSAHNEGIMLAMTAPKCLLSLLATSPATALALAGFCF